MGWYWMFVLVVIAFGSVFTGVGFSFENSQAKLRRSGISVNVEVIAMHERRDSDGDRSFRPEFRIISGDYEGKTWESKFSSNPPAHNVGDQEEGLYDPDTGKIQSLSLNRNYLLFSMIFSSIGLGLMISGAIFWFRVQGI